MKKCFFIAGIILMLCLLFNCSFQGAGAEDEPPAVTEEEAPEKEIVSGETKTENEEEESEEEKEGEEDEEAWEEDEGEGEKPNGEEEPGLEEELKVIPPPPVYLYLKTVSETEIVFGFSQPVTKAELKFDPELDFIITEKSDTVKVSLADELDPEQNYIAEIEVTDAYERTIKKGIPFRLRISQAPALQINELRTEYASKTNTTAAKAEFIEFKMLSGGNMGGLKVYVEGYYKAPLIYTFDPVEVKKSEYVVLHLRTLEDLCQNEFGEDLAESGGTDSSPTARDFWIPGSNKLLHNIDIIYVLDQDDNVLDAVMISKTPDLKWDKDYFIKAADFLFNQEAWTSSTGAVCIPADAVLSEKTTATRTICRDETVENTHTAADWYVTVDKGATPGKPNNPNRYKQ